MSLRVSILAAVALMNFVASAGTAATEADIKSILTTQAEAWNRGDLATFVTTYADDCTFVGKQILKGRSNLLARYQKRYPSPESMGKLTFQNLEVHQLDDQVATAIGEWHLDRTSASGGPIGGVFSLVLQLRHGTWQIVLDHTT
jgi:uncharacterized protein (TIGR02246 family)